MPAPEGTCPKCATSYWGGFRYPYDHCGKCGTKLIIKDADGKLITESAPSASVRDHKRNFVKIG